MADTTTKFGKLYALAQKAAGKKFTVTYSSEGEGKATVKMDGFPSSLTVAGVKELAGKAGGKLAISSELAQATGKGAGSLSAAQTVEMVTVMMDE